MGGKTQFVADTIKEILKSTKLRGGIPVHGTGSGPRFMEYCIGVLEEGRRGAEEGNHNLQGNCAHVSNINCSRHALCHGWESTGLNVIVTQLTKEHREWQEDRTKDT